VIDTALILRLRDQLLERGSPSMVPVPGFDLDGLAPYELGSLQRVTPLAELLFLMMSADGQSDGRELTAMRGAVRTLTDGMLRGVTVDRLVDRFSERLAREGLEERVSAVTAVLAADREDAEAGVMLVAAVALADDHVDAREQALFDLVTSYLGVGKRRIDELLDRR